MGQPDTLFWTNGQRLPNWCCQMLATCPMAYGQPWFWFWSDASILFLLIPFCLRITVLARPCWTELRDCVSFLLPAHFHSRFRDPERCSHQWRAPVCRRAGEQETYPFRWSASELPRVRANMSKSSSRRPEVSRDCRPALTLLEPRSAETERPGEISTCSFHVPSGSRAICWKSIRG